MLNMPLLHHAKKRIYVRFVLALISGLCERTYFNAFDLCCHHRLIDRFCLAQEAKNCFGESHFEGRVRRSLLNEWFLGWQD